jgi:nucleotide-binding universal stress UspA family protein
MTLSSWLRVDLDRILVATDLGPDADEAILQAHAWASIYGAELFACTILPTPFVRLESPLDRDPSWRAQVMLRQRLVDLTGRPPESTIAVRRGAPFMQICGLAEELEADLIVVGSSRRNGAHRSLLGGTAEKIVRCSRMPVLVARPSPVTASVLAATDLSDPCFPVIAAGADYAERRKGRFSVLHCIEHEIILPISSTLPSGTTFSPSHASLTKCKQALTRAMAGLDVDGEGIVARASSAQTAIVREARARGCEVVVVGTSGRRGLMRLAFGNLAESIVRTGPCSILVVRLGERSPIV